jgi:hypothetical protein
MFVCVLLKERAHKNQTKRLPNTKSPDSFHPPTTTVPATTTMKFSNSINTILFFFFLALLGMATPTLAAEDIMAPAAAEETTTEPAAVVPSSGLRGGTAQEHRSLYCSPTTYIYCMSKCRSRIYKSIIQCKRENPACAQPGCT